MFVNQSYTATKRKAQLIILAAFILGIVVGASGQYLLVHRTLNNQVGTSVKIIDELTRRLSLTSAQRIEIDVMLADARRQYQLLDDEVRPQYKAIRLDTRKRIVTLLTPEQQSLFEEYTRELDAKREAKEREAREKNLTTPTPAK
ncbi:MAG: hypothetical protein SF097_18215 [Acidobacteriota bacterium]|nr:hypothetical protein [Acidobacteriota bacterium]